MRADKEDIIRVLNQARIKLPGASDAGLKGELFDTFNDFFGTSSSWLEDIVINVLTGVTNYDVTAADDGQIIRLMGCVDMNNIPQPAMMPSFGTLVLVNLPGQPNTFTATFAKNVTLPNNTHNFPIVPDWVLGVYGTSVLDGLLGRMMSQVGKSYSNETMGTYHLKRWNDAIQGARIATLRRNTLGTQAWGFPQSYRTRGQKGGVSVGNDTRF